MLARHDVFNMKGNERGGVLGYAAIFASVAGARTNQLLDGRLRLCGVLRKKAPGLGLYDGNHVDGFHKFLVFGILGGRECPLVGLAAQFPDSILRLRVRA